MQHNVLTFCEDIFTKQVDFITSNYLSKSKELSDKVKDRLNSSLKNNKKDETIHQEPYIETLPSYKIKEKGIITSPNLDNKLKDFFNSLTINNLGVFENPYSHQVRALEEYYKGNDILVSTGTGSGKTECFIWPIIAKLFLEAANKSSFNKRAVRVILMYPMNALVSDQISRLRRLIGDTEHKFKSIFKEHTNVLRPISFGMYTGRTPFVRSTSLSEKKIFANNLARYLKIKESDPNFYKKLEAEGKIPAIDNLQSLIDALTTGTETSYDCSNDTELMLRSFMQQMPPDILITNYSMLEYMLIRNLEDNIWDSTKEYLNADADNKLLFVIDEAHMYRGAPGAEVALLLKRLFNRLNITRDKVQFILTTASLPLSNENSKQKVYTFFNDLTSLTNKNKKCIIIEGEKETISAKTNLEITLNKLLEHRAILDSKHDNLALITQINQLFLELDNSYSIKNDLADLQNYLYENLLNYQVFVNLINLCRGQARSIADISYHLFNTKHNNALIATKILILIASFAINKDHKPLFPIKVHLLYRGLQGIYACSNPNCKCNAHYNNATAQQVGKVFFSSHTKQCPECGSLVYELAHHRDCGALFFIGYINKKNLTKSTYLWQSSLDNKVDEIIVNSCPQNIETNELKKIYLYIPNTSFTDKSDDRYEACSLNIKTGDLIFKKHPSTQDERLLYFYKADNKNNKNKSKDDEFNFNICPQCNKRVFYSINNFKIYNNQLFFNLLKEQFFLQEANLDLKKEHHPNQGRKIIIFSDGRQKAAKIAKEFSELSNQETIREQLIFAIKLLNEENKALKKHYQYNLSDLYKFFAIVSAQHKITIPLIDNSSNFLMTQAQCLEAYIKHKNYISKYLDEDDDIPRLNIGDKSIDSIPKEYIIALLDAFCGTHKTFYSLTLAYLLPTQEKIKDIKTSLRISYDNKNLNEIDEITNELIKEIFNAFIIDVFNKKLILGSNLDDILQLKKCVKYNKYDNNIYALDANWEFSDTIKQITKFSEQKLKIWAHAFINSLLLSDNENYTLKFEALEPIFTDKNATWYKCNKCSTLSPLTLKGLCPNCASEQIYKISDEERKLYSYNFNFDFANYKFKDVIDIQEHTAQIGYKDNQDSLFTKAEEYELRFRDLIYSNSLASDATNKSELVSKKDYPVDILSCTTTMEVGIDIGSLSAVALRNIPPTRENYQQRAGRAGRRQSNLSSVITFCSFDPYDSLYFKDPSPIFNGEPRTPFIDINNLTLIYRHLNLLCILDFVRDIFANTNSIDNIAFSLFEENQISFFNYLQNIDISKHTKFLNTDLNFDENDYKLQLKKAVQKIFINKSKHAELFYNNCKEKNLLDILYEYNVIPNYSFPKNLVSTYIRNGNNGYINVTRGIDIAISEYAPGRNIVVDKKNYQIGGLFVPQYSENYQKAINNYLNDESYNKQTISCSKCNWFGLKDDSITQCPLCGGALNKESRAMLKPWGFAPKNAKESELFDIKEKYSFSNDAIFSTVINSNDVKKLENYYHTRVVSYKNQTVLLKNPGIEQINYKHKSYDGYTGFILCKDCGAIAPNIDNIFVTENYGKPYVSKYNGFCKHNNTINVDLGFDFQTDILVIEISLDKNKINTESIWKQLAAKSFTEAVKLAICKELDIDFSEIYAGFRIRSTHAYDYVDIFLYDSLSGGAGYTFGIKDNIKGILKNAEKILTDCDCDSSCFNCIKHLKNQLSYKLLNRFAAIDLFRYIENGDLPSKLEFEKQKELFSRFEESLITNGINIDKNNTIICSYKNIKCKIEIYPSYAKLDLNSCDKDTIYITNYSIRNNPGLIASKVINIMKNKN